MWRIIFIVGLISSTQLSFAQNDILKDNLPTILQGGDNISNAFPIPSIPFSDIGTTVGYTNDYSGNCGTDNGAPDVVYSFTPDSDQILMISLCQASNFDTRLYIFDGLPSDIVACNDDYCSNEFSDLLSGINCVLFLSGHTYYIVVDGNGTASGEYSIDIGPPTPGASIFGLVREFNSVPICGAQIRILLDGIPVWSDTSNYNGFFTAFGLNDGSYMVEASKPEFITQTQGPFNVIACLPVFVDFYLQRVNPPPVGAIAGIVRDSISLSPIEGVLVRALLGNQEIFRDTTLSGGLFLMPDMQLDFYDIEASKLGYLTKLQPNIEVVMNETTNVDILLLAVFAPCAYVVGDANCNNVFNGMDVTYSVNYFRGGPPPPWTCECPIGHNWFTSGDVNGSCTFDGLDVTYMVNYFRGGATPIPCPECPLPNYRTR